jgi:hypothetical protein
MKLSTRDKSLPQTWKDVSAKALNKLESISAKGAE